jgi:hypothetical protein
MLSLGFGRGLGGRIRNGQQPCLVIDYIPRIAKSEEYVAQMQFVEHVMLLDSLAENPSIDMAGIPRVLDG